MLIQDLKKDSLLQKVFNYISIESNKEMFQEQLHYLNDKQLYDVEYQIIKEIKWLFFTANNTYSLIGIREKKIWHMDDDGELLEASFNLENLPFYIYKRLPQDILSLTYKDIDVLVNAFIYYFDYCEKKNIKLLPENLAWKEKIIKFIKDNEI